MRSMKPMITLLGAAALLAASVVPAAAQDTEAPDLQTRIDAFVGLLPGGVAAITIKDGVTTTAAAGIADVDGTPFGVDTPVLLGGAGVMPLYMLALQLAEDGLIDLDEPVTTYLPDAPVADGATVRDVLTFRAGVPVLTGTDVAAVGADPERIFTTDDHVRGMAEQAIGSVGEFSGSQGNTLIVVQLIGAATSADAATVLAEHVTGPLGMTATRRPDGDPEAVGNVAAGWAAPAGEPVYLPNTSNASRTYRPTVTSAQDVATYLSALFAGELVSPELLESTVLDESIEIFAYGFLRPDEMSSPNLLGPSGTHWFGIVGQYIAGTNHVAAVHPDTGDVVVVIANNEDLSSIDLVRDILTDWDAGVTAVAASPAQGTLRYAPLSLCGETQPGGFGLAPCAADDEGTRVDFHAAFEATGTLAGIGSLDGVLIRRPDGTFGDGGGGSTAIFIGEVEGCGSGTIHFLVMGEGFYDEDEMPNYTRNTWEVVPGGTLPVSGSFKGLGRETPLDDYSTSFEFVGELSCADEGASTDA